MPDGRTESRNKTGNCGTCRFYDEIKTECHRFPPKGNCWWPIVDKTDWCGEYAKPGQGKA